MFPLPEGSLTNSHHPSIADDVPLYALLPSSPHQLKLFLFSLLVLLLVSPDLPRWAAASVAPATATLACTLGGTAGQILLLLATPRHQTHFEPSLLELNDIL